MRKHVSILSIALVLLSLLPTGSGAAVRTWDGGATADGKWSTSDNWSGNTAPTASDTALFDATSAEHCTSDVNWKVHSLIIRNGYTGTFRDGGTTDTVASGVDSMGSGGSLVLSGTLVHLPDADLTINATGAVTTTGLELFCRGTGTLTGKAGVSLDTFTCAQSGKTTTMSLVSLTPKNLLLGGGTFTATSMTVTPTSNLVWNQRGSTFNGTGNITFSAATGCGKLTIDSLNFTGTGTITFYASSSSACTVATTGGRLMCGRGLGIKKTSTGKCLVDLSNTTYQYATVGASSFGSSSSTDTLFIKLPQKSSNVSWDGFTTNTGVTVLNLGSSVDTVTTAWRTGSNTVVIPGTSELVFSGTVAQTTFRDPVSSNLYYDVSVNKSSGVFVDSSGIKTTTGGDFTVADAGTSIRHVGSPVFGGDAMYNGADTVFGPTTGSFTMNGASSQLHFQATSVTSATGDTLIFTGTTGCVLDVDATAQTFRGISLGNSAILTNSGASAYVIYSSSGVPLIVGDSATLTSNKDAYFVRTTSGKWHSIGSAATLTGSGSFYWGFGGNGIIDTLPATRYTGTGSMDIRPVSAARTGCVAHIVGAVSMPSGASAFGVGNGGISSSSIVAKYFSDVTCGVLRNGSASATTTISIAYGSGTFTISSFDGSSFNGIGASTDSMQSAKFVCSGNWSHGSNHTVVPGTSRLTITGASNVTSNGKTIADTVVFSPGAGNRDSLIDNLTASVVRHTSGKLKPGGKNITLTGKFISTGDSLFARMATCTLTVRDTCSFSSTWSQLDSLVVRVIGKTYMACAAAGASIKRMVFTPTTTDTMTFQANRTWTFGSLDSAAINGQAGALLTYRSSTPGTPFTWNTPSAFTARYVNPIDNTLTTGDSIYSQQSIDGGGNTGWRFPPSISYASPVSDTVGKAASHAVTNAGGATDSFTVTSALPTGLSLSSSTGAITGTPGAEAVLDTFTVIAWSVVDNDTASIAIAVVAGDSLHITSLVPARGDISGGTVVRVYGAQFGATRGTGAIWFGDSQALGYGVWGTGMVLCTTRSYPDTAHVAVKLKTGSGDSVVVANGYWYTAGRRLGSGRFGFGHWFGF